MPIDDRSEPNDGISPRSTGEDSADISKPDAGITFVDTEGVAERVSPILLDGIHQLVTPCHTYKVGLRASQMCATCSGDLSSPVETATTLICGHWITVTHTQGDRRITCAVCEIVSLIRAERVIVTRYFARPETVSEQFQLFE